MAKMTNIKFQVVSCSGAAPKLAFHSCSLVNNRFYLFGGVDDKKNVQNRLFCFDPSTSHWSKVGADSCTKGGQKTQIFNAVVIREPPKLSHHTATVLSDRYIFFIGGWTGHKRTSEVFYFDTLHNAWFQIEVRGDVPVGLSSHSASLVSDNEVIIVGREGGVRTQRRSGDSFLFNVETGVYKDPCLHVSSRSGHTANLVKLGKDYKLFVQGGRKDGGYELIGSWKQKPGAMIGISKDKISSLVSRWVVCTEPQGRQHCASAELNDRYLFFFGGETWSGVRNNVTNEVYVLDCHKMRWYRQAKDNGPCLTGHAMGILDENVYVFGGLLEGKCNEHVWLVQL